MKKAVSWLLRLSPSWQLFAAGTGLTFTAVFIEHGLSHALAYLGVMLFVGALAYTMKNA